MAIILPAHVSISILEYKQKTKASLGGAVLVLVVSKQQVLQPAGSSPWHRCPPCGPSAPCPPCTLLCAHMNLQGSCSIEMKRTYIKKRKVVSRYPCCALFSWPFVPVWCRCGCLISLPFFCISFNVSIFFFPVSGFRKHFLELCPGLSHNLQLILMPILLSLVPLGASPTSLVLSVFGLPGILTKAGGFGLGMSEIGQLAWPSTGWRTCA